MLHGQQAVQSPSVVKMVPEAADEVGGGVDAVQRDAGEGLKLFLSFGEPPERGLQGSLLPFFTGTGQVCLLYTSPSPRDS